ncbi:Retrovirus-related Pol polyprotein from transposon [Dictyocoela muelleri]|nr:Retrovirus-related Pol polyprotein from transposon [Dictyocoela muelleri]
MPFGLVNAPFTFQRIMNKLCKNALYKFIIVYLDDIIFFSNSIDEHLIHLEIIFKKISEYGFRLNKNKCEFLKSRVIFLGYEVENNEIRIPIDKKNTALNFKTPHNLKTLRSFFGFENYLHTFLPNFTVKMLPIYSAIKSKRICEKKKCSVNEIKNEINKAMPLKLPNLEKSFTIYTDASNFAIGAVLTLNYENKDTPIPFHSQKLSQSEINYKTTEKRMFSYN